MFKILCVGDTSAGKTSLIERLINKSFVPRQSGNLIGIDFHGFYLTINNSSVKLQIWDSPGQEKFWFLAAPYFKGAQGILFVFDMTSDSSLENIRSWAQFVRQNSAAVAKVLVGTKADLKESHSVRVDDRAAELARDYDMQYVKTSAFTGQGIYEAFHMVSQLVFDSLVHPSSPVPTKRLDPTSFVS